MARTPTPHNEAVAGQIAPFVLMPGDPLRAQRLAEAYLENVEQFNGVRNMLGYTGTYQGKRVSVMGHGMGIPSMAIYSYELFNFYGVKKIIRVGSAGSMNPDLHIGDLMLAQAACTNSNYASQFQLSGTFAPIADFALLRAAVEKAEELGYTYKVGNIYSSDIFYDENTGATAQWQKLGVLAVEMESAALYMNAARYGGRALCLCTISDSLVTGEATSAEQRQTGFTHMMDVAFGII